MSNKEPPTPPLCHVHLTSLKNVKTNYLLAIQLCNVEFSLMNANVENSLKHV